MSTLTEFLLARIDEDEAWWKSASLDGPSAEVLLRKQLREVDAKRRIVQLSSNVIKSFGDWDAKEVPGVALWDDVNRRERSHAWQLLHTLADVYAEHLDYREEWKP